MNWYRKLTNVIPILEFMLRNVDSLTGMQEESNGVQGKTESNGENPFVPSHSNITHLSILTRLILTEG